ncbi:MAG: recombinase family protein [Anaerobutyricum hallii]|uniref:recombinase family protein n=1 Tax=Anaerobutyricum hallii TaxID=39488 RepID=UPI002A7F249A|nr:recombinase family protein [Anaerobutyricum hallii]MDY4578310.1 recombinase family protein [Anaerobutyricum hallii]
MKALVYIIFSSSDEMREKLENHRNKVFAYCEKKNYIPLVVFEVTGPKYIQEEIRKTKILQLAKRRMIDVVVLSDLTLLGRDISEDNRLIEILKRYSVKIDCIHEKA